MAEAKAYKMIPHHTKDTITYEMDELVRCKDCKNGDIDSASYPGYWCSAHSEYHDADWFCADGQCET